MLLSPNDNRNLREYIIDFILEITNVFSKTATSEHSATLLKFIYILWAARKHFFVTTTYSQSFQVMKSKKTRARTRDHKNIVFEM